MMMMIDDDDFWVWQIYWFEGSLKFFNGLEGSKGSGGF